MCTSKKDSESEWLAKDNPKTNPITVKPETVSRVAELFWVPLPYCSPCGCPFPIKSLALSDMCLLRQFTSECSTGAQFRALEGSPFLQQYTWCGTPTLFSGISDLYGCGCELHPKRPALSCDAGNISHLWVRLSPFNRESPRAAWLESTLIPTPHLF